MLGQLTLLGDAIVEGNLTVGPSKLTAISRPQTSKPQDEKPPVLLMLFAGKFGSECRCYSGAHMETTNTDVIGILSPNFLCTGKWSAPLQVQQPSLRIGPPGTFQPADERAVGAAGSSGLFLDFDMLV